LFPHFSGVNAIGWRVSFLEPVVDAEREGR
jgi:hypothetical protein